MKLIDGPWNFIRQMPVVLATAVCLTVVTPTVHAGGVAIVNAVLTDDGDNDGFADTNETESMRLTVRNTSSGDLTNVAIALIPLDAGLVCVSQTTIDVGNLAAGEERLTEEAFVFSVPAGVDRDAMGLGALDNLSASFDLAVSSQPENQPAVPSSLTLDLDLDVSAGGGDSAFFESFEETLGAFEIDNMDQGKTDLTASDGWRCQYHDPDWINSNNYDHSTGPDCFLGNTPAHADAVFWGLSGPTFSPLGGRGFSGFHALFFGIDLGPPQNWTSPMSMLEAVQTSEPINLGWDNVSPTLSIKHQISLVDARTVNLPPDEAADRGVVMAQVADDAGNGVGPWIKLFAFQNPYDQIGTDNFFGCMYDPIDDGNNEDDFFDPADPSRDLGPSSTCLPAEVFANLGETSNPFVLENIGRADGPGLVGNWGIGTWIESSFDLSRFRGRRVHIRFLATSLKYPPNPDDWELFFPGLNPNPGDDGWWIDDVTVDGALTAAATVAIDAKDNGSLPGPPGGDTDTDGLHDVCDNCVAAVNPDQADVDGDGTGDACDACPVHPFVEDHDSDGLCAELDNCPFDANPGQANGDADPAGTACDCDDTDPATYPGAEEVNDGVDNNCSGVADETSNQSGFYNPNDKNEYSWPAQAGAIWYQAARGNSADFSVGCTIFGPFPQIHVVDVEPLPSGEVRYYMNRSFVPNQGSWGQDWSGLERDVPCD